jgi:hypothetical protein
MSEEGYGVQLTLYTLSVLRISYFVALTRGMYPFNPLIGYYLSWLQLCAML